MICEYKNIFPSDISSAIDFYFNIEGNIKSIWLFGSRANGQFRNESDWDMIFECNDIFIENIKKRHSYLDNKIDSLFTTDWIDAIQPWETISKSGIKRNKKIEVGQWRKLTENEFEYKSLDISRMAECYGPDPYITLYSYRIFPIVSNKLLEVKMI